MLDLQMSLRERGGESRNKASVQVQGGRTKERGRLGRDVVVSHTYIHSCFFIGSEATFAERNQRMENQLTIGGIF